jgi:methylenetetrahydrofolate dehydrogenase (NADP+)/methenyltetrahydrofolate cyclohydrolase
LEEKIKNADILIVAMGKAKYVKDYMVKDGAVVIDVGINRTEKGLCGDVDYDEVSKKASYITPVPGGVGPMTVAMLLKNTVSAFKINKQIV